MINKLTCPGCMFSCHPHLEGCPEGQYAINYYEQFQQLQQIKNRITDIQNWLIANDPLCFDQQKHCIEGTTERIYWHYGYFVALKDVINLINGTKNLPQD